MLELAFVLTAISCSAFGYFLRTITDKLNATLEVVKNLRAEPEAAESKSVSTIVEPLTPEQQARKDFEDRVKKLNGQV